jgi:hypothetical protein
MGAGDMEDGRSAQVERLIRYAVRAGAFRAGARTYPQAAETMLAAAQVNSERVRRAAEQIAMARGCSLGANRTGG